MWYYLHMYSRSLMLASIDLIAIIGELIVLANSSKNNKDVGQPVFNSLIKVLMFVTFTDLLSWFLVDVKTDFFMYLGILDGFFNYFLPNVAWWIWLIYAYSFISKAHTKSRTKAFFICSSIPTLISFALLIANLFTGIYYYYDAAGHYYRGEYYWVNTCLSSSYMIWFFILMVMDYIRTNSSTHRKYIVYLFGFAFLPIIGLISEQLFYGLYFAPVFSFYGVLMVYLNVQKERISGAVADKEKADAEVEDAKVKVMLSQIKPHFLFNTLNIIRSLITRDSKTAVEAVDHFADYLRENMTSLEHTECIPFEEELRHVENYLYIEKLRFKGHLNVEYDIHSTSFSIPPLALQVLVENAVKHGISPKEEPGTVTIRTSEDSECYMVLCEDDGVGFDVNRKVSKSHVGIRNIRMRLDAMCSGSLHIDSTIGKGTMAIISIPKNQK